MRSHERDAVAIPRLSGQVDWTSHPPMDALAGEVCVPGDKSISHRAVLLGAIADGDTRIDGFLEAADTRATAAAFAGMGVAIETPGPQRRIVHGAGLHGLRAPAAAIDCGNSGTAMRLLAGALAGQAFDSVLTGDASLCRRPMRRVVEPLSRMGAGIEAAAGGVAPLSLRGGRALRGIAWQSPVASAQVKSAILLAGLYASGTTCVAEPAPSRDHTERMLAAFACPVAHTAAGVCVTGGCRPRAPSTAVTVPGDFSSAAFFIVAASLVPGSVLCLHGVGMNPRRIGLLAVLGRMGANIRVDNPRLGAGEPVADLEVRHAVLHGTDVGPDGVADLIDEFPVLAIAAACARGRTVVRGATELRVKESDRIAVVCAGLRALGARVEATADGAVIEGGVLAGGTVDSAGDHRCAMAFCVAGLMARAAVTVRDCANVATSFPGFVMVANDCGFRLAERDGARQVDGGRAP
jgi:3-phosphoshikimate 1-carboxyvinyltransferase